jgi:hypothetical protein
MIYTLSIQCVSGPNLIEPFKRTVEVPSHYSLGDLHWLILDLVEFDEEEHLTGYYVARTWEGPKAWLLDDSDETPWEKTLEEIFPLPARRHLYFLYVFGNSWFFEIRKEKENMEEEGFEYPCLIKSTGPPPTEFPVRDDF